MITSEQDWAEQAAWKADRDRRFAARVEQRLLHEADPERYSVLVPVDDPEFGTEAYVSAWRDEDLEPEDGFVIWHGDTEDAADSEANDIDDEDDYSPQEFLIARSVYRGVNLQAESGVTDERAFGSGC